LCLDWLKLIYVREKNSIGGSFHSKSTRGADQTYNKHLIRLIIIVLFKTTNSTNQDLA